MVDREEYSIFKFSGGTSDSKTFWVGTPKPISPRSWNVNSRYSKMSFWCRSDILNLLFPPTLSSCRRTPTSRQITLSCWWNNLQVGFVSIAVAKTPQSTMSAGHLAPFISPLMPFNFIAMTTDTHALSGFMTVDISLLNEEWGGAFGRVFSANSGSRQSECWRRRLLSLWNE